MPYFDHNATTPLAPLARETWLRAVDEHWQNPSSPYRAGAKARIRLDQARERVADFFGVKAEGIVFNSGATEGAHAVLRHLSGEAPSDHRLLVNRTEHPCVRAAAEQYFTGRIRWIDTDARGVVASAQIERELAAGKVAAVVTMAANNETGVIQPCDAIGRSCRAARVPFLCDASQWMGKLPASGLGEVDWVICTGHKFGAPKGVGLIKIPAQAKGFIAQEGGGQENGHRGGTENLASIWALAAALADAEQTKVMLELERLRWRDGFERRLAEAVPGAVVLGQGAERLWNTVAMIMPAGENHRWVARLDKLDFQVATGSACSTGQEGSHGLAAMGVPADEAKRMLRISAGWGTLERDWDALTDALAQVWPHFAGAPANVVKL